MDPWIHFIPGETLFCFNRIAYYGLEPTEATSKLHVNNNKTQMKQINNIYVLFFSSNRNAFGKTAIFFCCVEKASNLY